jgi:iron complex outermembrane receptor protein
MVSRLTHPVNQTRIVPALLAACVLLLAISAPARSGDDPVGAWQQRLAQVEARLGRLAATDAEGRGRLAADIAGLRAEISTWLTTFPPAEQGGEAWLPASGGSSSVADLATEIGRLRSALSRINSALGREGEGAFYLGRVDVAVTATMATAATADATPAGASLLDASDLRANDTNTLSQALALAPGVSFTRIGSRNETTAYVRGFDMRQVPLFIDGIPIYTPYDGYADLGRFTTFDVSEVQVSKGFTSVLYGPNTLGGAINIVSRRPSGGIQGIAGASYGTGPAGQGYVNAGSKLGDFYLQGGASFMKSDTFPLADGFTPVAIQPAGDRINAAQRDAKFNVKMGWTPNGTDEYAISYVGQRSEKGNPPYAGTDTSVKIRYWQWPYWDKDSVYLVANKHLGSVSYLRVRGFYDTYDNALYSYDDKTYTTQVKASSFQSLYADHTYGGSIEWGTTIGTHTLRAAGHLKRDEHEDHNVGSPASHFDGRIFSIGAEDTWLLAPKLSLVAGLGIDWQTTGRAQTYQSGQLIDLLTTCQSGTDSCGGSSGVNPQAGLFYAVPTGQVRFTVSRKTRMPSLKDRYSYKFGTAVPNPDLKAEHDVTVETGYQGTLGAKTSFQVSAFSARITDLIQSVYVQPNLMQMQNFGEASNSGVELDMRTHVLPKVDFGVNYTYLHRENISSPTTPLVETPRHKGRVSLIAMPVHVVQVVANVDVEAGRRTQNEAGHYFDAPSFAILDVKGVWIVRQALNAELGVFNAFDKYYWRADGYPEPGRTVQATLRWTF